MTGAREARGARAAQVVRALPKKWEWHIVHCYVNGKPNWTRAHLYVVDAESGAAWHSFSTSITFTRAGTKAVLRAPTVDGIPIFAGRTVTRRQGDAKAHLMRYLETKLQAWADARAT